MHKRNFGDNKAAGSWLLKISWRKRRGTRAASLAGRADMDVIVSATRIDVEALGLEDKLGTIEKGKPADLIVISGGPLQNISILRDKKKITGVYIIWTVAPRRNTTDACATKSVKVIIRR